MYGPEKKERDRKFLIDIRQEGASIPALVAARGLPENYVYMFTQLKMGNTRFKKIGEACGLARQTVDRWAKLMDADTKSKQVRRAEQSLLAGKTNLTKGARDHGLTASTLRELARKHGIHGTGKHDEKPAPKKQAIEDVLVKHPDFTNQQIVDKLAKKSIRVTPAYVNLLRNPSGPQREKFREPSLDERRSILTASFGETLETIGQMAGGFSDRTVAKIRKDNWISVGVEPLFNTRLFYAAAEELLRRELRVLSGVDLATILVNYLCTLSPATFNDIFVKYTLHNSREEYIAKSLKEFSDSHVSSFLTRYGTLSDAIDKVPYLHSIKPTRAVAIIHQRLNRHPTLSIEPIAYEAINRFSVHDAKLIVNLAHAARGTRRHVPDRLSHFEGVRESSPKRTFLDIALGYYFRSAAVRTGKEYSRTTKVEGLDHFQRLTEQGYVALKGIPFNVYRAMQLFLAARGTIFSRMKVRYWDDRGKIKLAPARADIEMTAKTILQSLVQA